MHSDISHICSSPSDIVLVCPTLGHGGTQRVIATVGNRWSQEGRRILIVTCYERAFAYEFDDKIDHICLETLINQKSHRKSGGLSRRSQKKRNVEISDSHEQGCEPMNGLGGEAIPLHRLRNLSAVSAGTEYLDRLMQKPINLYGRVRDFWLLVMRLRDVIGQSQSGLVISFIGYVNLIAIMACRTIQTKLVISERNDPSRQKLRTPWNYLRRLLYKKADLVTANSHYALESLKEFVPEEKLAFLPNPLVPPQIENRCSDEIDEAIPFVLAVGRLYSPKAFDVLLRAFQLNEERMPDWRLVIIGEGNLKASLKRLAKDLKISRKVIWVNRAQNLHAYYKAAGLLAMPSLFEGMSNVLLEAMNHGLPVVITDSCPGSLELVDDQISGLVVPVRDHHSLAKAIYRITSDTILAEKLGAAARERVRPFHLDTAMTEWQRVLALVNEEVDLN